MDSFVHISQKTNSVPELLRCAITTVEIAGDGIDLPARRIHKVNGIPSFRLPVQDRAVGCQLRHQPCVGGQIGRGTLFLKQVIVLGAHADAGTRGLFVRILHSLPAFGNVAGSGIFIEIDLDTAQ